MTHGLWQAPYLHLDPLVTFFWLLHLTDVKLVFNSELKQEAHELQIWVARKRIIIAQTKRELSERDWNERLGLFTLLSLNFLTKFERDISLTGQICNWCASQFWQDTWAHKWSLIWRIYKIRPQAQISDLSRIDENRHLVYDKCSQSGHMWTETLTYSYCETHSEIRSQIHLK